MRNQRRGIETSGHVKTCRQSGTWPRLARASGLVVRFTRNTWAAEGGVKLAAEAAARIDRRAVGPRWTQARQRAVPPKAKPGSCPQKAPTGLERRGGSPDPGGLSWHELRVPAKDTARRAAISYAGFGRCTELSAAGDRGDNKPRAQIVPFASVSTGIYAGRSRGPTIRYCWIVDPLDAPQLRASCRSSACPWLSRHAPGGRGTGPWP